MYDFSWFIDEGLYSQETIDTVCGIYGVNESVFNDLLFYSTGYRSWQQYTESEELDI